MGTIAISRIRRWGAVAALCLVFAQPLFALVPTPVHAQGTTPATGAQTQTATQQPPTMPDGCATSWKVFLSSPVACFTQDIAGIVFGSFVYLASHILTIFGLLFNFLIEYVIIGFSTNIYNSIQTPLQTVWSTFRDLANILIVGMFVFIAISIILEVQEFGRKRLVVDVIIIAVLINFSLLFTKLAIDASNFVAHQFYTATLTRTAGQGQGTGTGGTGDPAAARVGQGSISGQFLEYMGVTGFADTVTALANSGPGATQGAIAGGLTVMLHGIMTSIALLGAAAIFLYGSYLLVVRGVVIILLLLFSSLAFATYLVPGKSRHMFNAWLSELISVVVFAPLLMLMLWATLQIAKALKATPGSGTLGSLISNPTASQGNFVASLFSYLVILGLLYATFYIANSLSHKAKGMSTVSGTLGVGAWKFGAVPVLRNTIGRGAAWAQGKFEDRAGARMKEATATRSNLGNIMAGKDAKQIEAQRKAAATKASTLEHRAVGAQKKAELFGKVAGLQFGTKKSFSSIITDRTKAAEKITKKLQPSDEDKEKIRAEAAKVAATSHEQQKQVLETTKQAAEETMKTVQEAAKSSTAHVSKQEEIRSAKEAVAQAEKKQEDAEKDHSGKLNDLRRQAAEATAQGNEDETRKKQEKVVEEEIKRQTDRKSQADKIKQARDEVAKLEREYKELKLEKAIVAQDGTTVSSLQEASDKLVLATENLNKHLKTPEGKVKSEEYLKKEAYRAADKAVAETMQGIGQEMGKRSGSIADRLWGGMTGANAIVGKEVAKKFKYKDSSELEKLAKKLDQMKKDSGEDDKTGDTAGATAGKK